MLAFFFAEEGDYFVRGGFEGTDLAALAHLENHNACRRGLAQSILRGIITDTNENGLTAILIYAI